MLDRITREEAEKWIEHNNYRFGLKKYQIDALLMMVDGVEVAMARGTGRTVVAKTLASMVYEFYNYNDENQHPLFITTYKDAVEEGILPIDYLKKEEEYYI